MVISMETSNLVIFTSEDLKSLTQNFHERNLIGTTQFGKLYRGWINPDGRDVTVKIWDEKSNCLASVSDEYLMVKEEVQFLTHPTIKGHPNLIKLIGVCCDKKIRGVIYDLNTRDTLHNLILRDNLSWVQRVSIMVQLSCLLEYLHTRDKPYMVLNISASHIMLDWDYNLKLCDFGLVNGGSMGEINTIKKQIPMPIGYADPFSATKVVRTDLVHHKDGYRQSSCDVFSFGVVLLSLISKRVFDPDKVNKPELMVDNLVHCWAKNEYRPNCSVVHKSLREDWGYNPEDGTTITEIGIHCTEFFPRNRPTMKDIIQRLQSLLVLQRLGDTRPNKRGKKFHADHEMGM